MGLQKNILVLSLLTSIIFLPVSMAVCHVALAIYILAWASEGHWKLKTEMLKENPLIWIFLGFLALHITGISYSENTANGWFNVEKKIYFFLLPLVFATSISLDKKTIQLLFNGFIFACVFVTLYCVGAAFYHYRISLPQNNFDNATLLLYQQLNPGANPPWMFFSYIELASGIGMHPTYLALYLVFSIMLLIHLHWKSFITYGPLKKTGTLLLFFYLEVIIVLLSSRILILAFTLIALFSSIFILRSLKVRPALRVISLIMVLAPVVTVLLLNPVTRYRNLQEPAILETYESSDAGVYSYSTGIRKSLWMVGLIAVQENNPVIGAGTGDVKEVMKKAGEQSGETNIMNSSDPHNQFLYTQIALGILGTIILALCLFLPLGVAFRQKNYLYFGFIFLFTIVCTTESVLESQKGIVFFAIFNSILVFPYCRLSVNPFKKLTYG